MVDFVLDEMINQITQASLRVPRGVDDALQVGVGEGHQVSLARRVDLGEQSF